MLFEICAVVFVLLFAILVFYIIRTLLSLQQTLRKTNHLIRDVEYKMHHLNSSFKTLSNVGDLLETETDRLKKKFIDKQEGIPSSRTSDLTMGLAELALISIKLFLK